MEVNGACIVALRYNLTGADCASLEHLTQRKYPTYVFRLFFLAQHVDVDAAPNAELN